MTDKKIEIERRRCVMCGAFPEKRMNRDTEEIVDIYFIDPKTKEQLCEKCNDINNGIYRAKGEKIAGKLRIIKNDASTM